MTSHWFAMSWEWKWAVDGAEKSSKLFMVACAVKRDFALSGVDGDLLDERWYDGQCDIPSQTWISADCCCLCCNSSPCCHADPIEIPLKFRTELYTPKNPRS